MFGFGIIAEPYANRFHIQMFINNWRNKHTFHTSILKRPFKYTASFEDAVLEVMLYTNTT